MNIRLLLTSAGGLVVPSMIKSLKDVKNDTFHITAIDTRENAVGFYFADRSYVVPEGTKDNYTSVVLDIAKKEKTDVILPLSDEETLALSKAKDDFLKEKVKVVCSEYDKVKIASNKAEMLKFLEERSLPVPKYKVPHSLSGLKEATFELGYPDKPVVFKPTQSRGARGFWIIRADLDKRKSLIFGRDRQEITLEILTEALGDTEPFPSVLVMEYLGGDDFNVDILAERGKTYYVIPNKRIIPKAGPVQVGHILENEKVKEMAKRITAIFEFDYFVNIEMAYPRNDNKNEPLVYEINPRASAPIIANKAAGVDLLYLGIKMALGAKPPTLCKIKETKMIRYWNELFFDFKREFNPF